VLIAMGLEPEVAQTAVRFTFGRSTTTADLDRTAEELTRAVGTVAGLRA
jgi:cysteine desulfurase